MKHTENEELTPREVVKIVFIDTAIIVPLLGVWVYIRPIVWWIADHADAVRATLWGTVALIVAVGVVAVWRTIRKNKPKRFGTIPAEMIRTIMK